MILIKKSIQLFCFVYFCYFYVDSNLYQVLFILKSILIKAVNFFVYFLNEILNWTFFFRISLGNSISLRVLMNVWSNHFDIQSFQIHHFVFSILLKFFIIILLLFAIYWNRLSLIWRWSFLTNILIKSFWKWNSIAHKKFYYLFNLF